MNNIRLSKLLETIPAAARATMSLEEFQTTHIKILVKDEIQNYFKRAYTMQGKLTSFKRSLGFCTTPVCLHISGKDKYCYACRKEKQKSRRQNKRSEYGRMRMQEKQCL
jgi:hypothetical protein